MAWTREPNWLRDWRERARSGGPEALSVVQRNLWVSHFALPETATPWRVVVDTSKPSPEDIAELGEEALLPYPGMVTVSSRSTVILVTGWQPSERQAY